MAKQYLTVNGQLVMNNGKLIQVPDPDRINDLLDEQDGYATQLKEVSDEVSNLALNGLVDGTPRGSFQTLEQLQSEYPDGTPGIYVITKTGEWCYYNEGWKIGGNYIEPDSGGGASITANIKVTGNKGDILGSTTEKNKLCILNDTNDLTYKVVSKMGSRIGAIGTLSTTLPQNFSKSCSATYGNNIYIFGGYDGTNSLKTIYKFNCNNRTIEQLNVTLPISTYSACCATYGDNIYIFGGYYLKTIFKFNCTNETIEQLSVNLPKNLHESCCAIYNDNVYIFGGINVNTLTKDIYKFNCTNQTISTLSVQMPKGLGGQCCAIYENNVYIFGGRESIDGVTTIYKFNCTNNSITTLSTTLPRSLSYASCAIYDDNIHIFGGNSLNTILKFNCTNETIEKLSETLPSTLKYACCSLYLNTIYIFGGYSSSYVNTIYNFSFSFELTANNVLLYCANSDYSFDLITDQVTIPIKNVYIGDSNNMAQLANAYIYKEDNWYNINTGEVLTA